MNMKQFASRFEELHENVKCVNIVSFTTDSDVIGSMSYTINGKRKYKSIEIHCEGLISREQGEFVLKQFIASDNFVRCL